MEVIGNVLIALHSCKIAFSDETVSGLVKSFIIRFNSVVAVVDPVCYLTKVCFLLSNCYDPFLEGFVRKCDHDQLNVPFLNYIVY